MKIDIIKRAKRLKEMSPFEAGTKMKKIYNIYGADITSDLLEELSYYNNSEWWLDMISWAGKEVKNLY